MPQPKSGCTGAIFPSSRHELKAWQTGGVHVRSIATGGLVAGRLEDLSPLLGRLPTMSRDFQ
jgi:hypothetical protein